MDQNVVAVVSRPEAMRWVVLIVLGIMIVPCVLIAIASVNASPLTALLMLGLAAGGGLLARALILTESRAVLFDGTAIYDDAGTQLCTLDDIVEIERGLALFKPSGGFVVVMKTPGARGWSPGLWWRVGRRLGIGGATSGRAAKYMADAIMGALAARQIS
ncbi:MAG: hypothetical protein AAF367_09750 [Pseudomonadota bacterium]